MPREHFAVAAIEATGGAEFDQTHDLRLKRIPLKLATWGVFGRQGLTGYLKALRSIIPLVRQDRTEMVHCGALLPDGWLGWSLYRLLGIPYLVYMHGEELHYTDSSRELTWMANRVLRNASLVIANSSNTTRLLRDRWRVPAEKIKLLHPGVDAEVFKPAKPCDQMRRELGWEGRRVILTVGRLQERKGHDMLIRALPAICEKIPNVLYSIVGAGEEQGRLQALAGECAMRDHVQFRGNPVDEELVRCYQQCDLFVLPNREVNGDIEGFGMVLVEAQACGKAVIAGKSGGTAETMIENETGWLVDCRNSADLATAILNALGDPQILVTTGIVGRAWVEEQFDWENLATQAKAMFNVSI